MHGFVSELADLVIMLSLICIPLATGAIAIPLGRALADRYRRSRMLGSAREDALEFQRWLVDRMDQVESTTNAVLADVERLTESHEFLVRALTSQQRLAQGRGLPTPHGVSATTPH